MPASPRSVLRALAALTLASPFAAAQEWPGWRGPTANGHAAAADPPVSWSEDENVLWRVDLPGVGTSTPVVVGDRLYLTTAVPNDREVQIPARKAQAPGGEEMSFPAATVAGQDLILMAFDRHTGEELLRVVLGDGTPVEKGHETSSSASPSPVTDGERIYAPFGSMGLFCTDLAGEVLWQRDLGDKLMANFGEGSSPALANGVLVVSWDHEGPSFVVGLDSKTGKELWRQERASFPSWASPVIVEVDGRHQVIAAASGVTHGYDLQTGAPIWQAKNPTIVPIAGPLVADGVAYVMNNYQKPFVHALQLSGAKGELTGTEHELWTYRRSATSVPMPWVANGLLFFLRGNTGTLQCLDAATGEVVYDGQRLRQKQIFASPVVVGDRIYLPARSGETIVFRAGREYEELARNELDAVFDASPVVIGDRLYLRGRTKLYCIGE